MKLSKQRSPFEQPGFTFAEDDPDFSNKYHQAIELLKVDADESLHLKCLQFLISSFERLENPSIRKECFKTIGVGLLNAVQERGKIFASNPRLRKLYDAKEPHDLSFVSILDNLIPRSDAIRIRLVEWLIDLLSALPTRKYVKIILEEFHFVPQICTELLEWTFKLPAAELNDQDVSNLQKRLFAAGISTDLSLKPFVESEKFFELLFSSLSPEKIADILAVRMKDSAVNEIEPSLVQESLALKYSPFHPMNLTPFLTESDFSSTNSMPKLGIQYVSLEDYLSRSFVLFKQNAIHDIQEDIEDAIKRIQPIRTSDGKTAFAGWSRYATEIVSLAPGKIGINISKYSSMIKQEWKSLRSDETLYLIEINSDLVISSFRCCSLIEISGDSELNLTTKYLPDSTCDISFNILLRRPSRENNFKAILDFILESRKQPLISNWLKEPLLGYIQKQDIKDKIRLVVGPPGSGKTKVACDLVKELLNSNPNERILLVTQSNQAIDAVFANLSSEIIDPLKTVRLGMSGVDDSEAQDSFSKYGRSKAWQRHRDELLEIASVLFASLGICSSPLTSCEAALYLFKFWIAPFLKDSSCPMLVPFVESDFYKALGRDSDSCSAYIHSIFTQIKECLPFEVLRNEFDRANYVLASKARFIAATFTHVALKRADFHSLAIKCTTLIIEEAGQFTEIETALPMFLAGSSLEQFVLIGDHLQLPPVIKSQTLRESSHFDQSMFVRFLRLGIEPTLLKRQYRCRPEISRLFSWRYPGLEDDSSLDYPSSIAGFTHPVQFVSLHDPASFGEIEPHPHYYQNLAEAEMIVSTFQWMRINGHLPEKIAILATYNGQVALLREVLERKCSSSAKWSSVYGAEVPIVSTVDRFQGMQADYVLLSLVRTKAFGHFADLRRFTVAVSRSRFGLWIFGKESLFCTSENEVGAVLCEKVSFCGALKLIDSKGQEHEVQCASALNSLIEGGSTL